MDNTLDWAKCKPGLFALTQTSLLFVWPFKICKEPPQLPFLIYYTTSTSTYLNVCVHTHICTYGRNSTVSLSHPLQANTPWQTQSTERMVFLWEFPSCLWDFNSNRLRGVYVFKRRGNISRLLSSESHFETEWWDRPATLHAVFTKSFKGWMEKPIRFSSQDFPHYFSLLQGYIWRYGHVGIKKIRGITWGRKSDNKSKN